VVMHNGLPWPLVLNRLGYDRGAHAPHRIILCLTTDLSLSISALIRAPAAAGGHFPPPDGPARRSAALFAYWPFTDAYLPLMV
jgi:hypothetical protein